MSGIVGSKLNIRGSDRIAKLGTDGQVLTSAGAGLAAGFEDIAAGISWQSVVTGSTLTAVAGEGYWVDTTSNACTITLPASASVGDSIIFADYARNWGTNKIIIDSNGLNYQGDDDTFTVEYATDGLAVGITYMNATKGWVPTIDEAVTDVPERKNLNGIFAYGHDGSSFTAVSNLVNSSGVVATDVSGVGTARVSLAATEYGGDKGIFGYGSGVTAATNLVSNTGVVGSDVTGVGTARQGLAACAYGGDKGIFGFGHNTVSMTNLVSNTGVVGTDVTGVGTGRHSLSATEYGEDKGFFCYGDIGSGLTAISNLVSNVGVVATDVSGVGTARKQSAGCRYSTDKGIFAYGVNAAASNISLSNKVSNSGVMAADVTGVGTARTMIAATQYGQDKGIFGFGSGPTAITNLVSNSGVIATDTSGVGTGRTELKACSYN
jgi:hypothetical protein